MVGKGACARSLVPVVGRDHAALFHENYFFFIKEFRTDHYHFKSWCQNIDKID
jgi:hypothetical protein